MNFFVKAMAFLGMVFKPEQSLKMPDKGRKRFVHDIMCKGIPP